MLERAIVDGVAEGNTVSLILCPDAACTSCAACRMFDKDKPQTVRAANSRGLDLVPGQLVEIYLPPWKTVRAAFLILILPLVLFGACYLAVGSAEGVGEPLRVLISIAALLGGFSLNYLRRGNQSELPEIMRVLRAEPVSLER